jgi:hypothetical protein
MNRKALAYSFACVVLVSAVVLAAASRHWQTGTLMETEQQKVREGSTKNSNTDGSAKERGNKTQYSQNTTTTQTDNFETYQIYTIEMGNKIYVAREHLLFPWSKPANVTVGESVKVAVEKNKLYILDANEKQHKATITKVSMKSTR